MALQLPDWYKGPHFRNLEDALRDFLQNLLPNVEVVHWFKPGWYTPGDGKGTEPSLRIWRMPGGRDYHLKQDDALIQVAAVSRARADSWKLIEFVGDMFETFNRGSKLFIPGYGRVMAHNELWLGPQQIPEGLIDEFFVPQTWKFTVKGDKLIPDYGQIVDSLSV